MITFGGDGSFFKADCDDYVLKYDNNSEKWVSVGNEKAFSFTADSEGTLWIVDYQLPYHVHRWNNSTQKWQDMGLNKRAQYITAG